MFRLLVTRAVAQHQLAVHAVRRLQRQAEGRLGCAGVAGRHEPAAAVQAPLEARRAGGRADVPGEVVAAARGVRGQDVQAHPVRRGGRLRVDQLEIQVERVAELLGAAAAAGFHHRQGALGRALGGGAGVDALVAQRRRVDLDLPAGDVGVAGGEDVGGGEDAAGLADRGGSPVRALAAVRAVAVGGHHGGGGHVVGRARAQRVAVLVEVHHGHVPRQRLAGARSLPRPRSSCTAAGSPACLPACRWTRPAPGPSSRPCPPARR